MTTTLARANVGTHLEALLMVAPRRPPGSPANRAATDYVAGALRDAGLEPTELPFRARYWTPGVARLKIDGDLVGIQPPPFCGPASASGTAVIVTSAGDLDLVRSDGGAVLVLEGELASPLFPKAFPFLSMPEQVALIGRLEALRPAAVLAVVDDDSAHEPVFEDPDLAFPYATIPGSIGEKIVPGTAIRLEVDASLDDGEGVNVSAGAAGGRRTVVCAHVDSKVTTPGALDNGGGVAALLALAERGLQGLTPVELVFFNGEDHYAAPGEQAWLAARDLTDVELVINVDGAGLRGYPAAVSTIGLPVDLQSRVEQLVADAPALVMGVPWFESDHAVFAMRGIPAIAITSAAPFDLLKRRSHAQDSFDDIDLGVLDSVAELIRALLAHS